MSASIEIVKKIPNLLELFENDNELLKNVSFTIYGAGIIAFVLLTFIDSPYGMHASAKFGFPVPGKLAWMIQESPNIIIPFYFLWKSWPLVLESLPTTILVSLFLVHYLQRAFIFPLLIRGGKPSPFLVFFFAVIFCCVNAFLQIQNLLLNPYPNIWLTQPNFIAGCALFFIGLAINLHSDHTLRNLRKPGETGYKVPNGGMFRYVSAANFFGETIEWLGFAVATWSFIGFSFFFFTVCNLAPRATSHHKWYKQKFEDYPVSRKAYIPFVW